MGTKKGKEGRLGRQQGAMPVCLVPLQYVRVEVSYRLCKDLKTAVKLSNTQRKAFHSNTFFPKTEKMINFSDALIYTVMKIPLTFPYLQNDKNTGP